MLFSTRVGRFAAGASLGIVSLGVCGGTILAVTHPSVAAAAIAAVTSVTCAVTGTNACVTGADTSSGIGVLGTSNTGTGVRGSANSNYGIKGSSGSSYGVFGTSTSSAGVVGSAFGSDGVYGFSTSSRGGTGVLGASSVGYGVEGTSTAGSGTGVYGFVGGGGLGVLGYSSSGPGLEGVSGELPLVLKTTSGTTVAYVDSVGNLFYAGSLVSFAKAANGAVVTSYNAKSASPTLEDSGTAQLAGGAVTVRLDPTFAASIDHTTGYRVFITPDGDTHGLFVAAKTPVSFIVHEAQGGRSSVSFDYRIVATAAGQTGQRMAVRNAAMIPHQALPASLVPQLPPTKAP